MTHHIKIPEQFGLRHDRLAWLARLVKREQFDVVHSHLFGSNLWGALIGRACGVPVVLAHEHTWSFSGNKPRMLIDGQLISRLSTRFLAVSAADRERMISLSLAPVCAANTISGWK